MGRMREAYSVATTSMLTHLISPPNRTHHGCTHAELDARDVESNNALIARSLVLHGPMTAWLRYTSPLLQFHNSDEAKLFEPVGENGESALSLPPSPPTPFLSRALCSPELMKT